MIIIPSMALGYKTIIDHVYENGRHTSPRGIETLEVPDLVFRLDDPTKSLAHSTGRKLNPAIAAMEAAQLIGGFLDPALMVSVSKNFEKFMDDGTFHGGYGERIGNQVLMAAQKLIKDDATRQAVVTIWDKDKDNLPGFHDYPCTLSLTFQIRDDKLELHTTMRSNDVWLGLPYDVFQFTQLQCTVANVLGLGYGPYFHHAVSMHLYLYDVVNAMKLESVDALPGYISLIGFGNRRTYGTNNIFGVLQRARMIGQGREDEVSQPSLTEQWFIAQLAKYTTKKKGSDK